MVPALETIKFRLRDWYTNEQILILAKPGARTYFVLMESIIDILDERFYSKKTSDETEILRKTAKIIRRDMRTEIILIDRYPASDNFLDDSNKYIPESLLHFDYTTSK